MGEEKTLDSCLSDSKTAEVMADPTGGLLLRHLLDRLLSEGGEGLHLRVRGGVSTVEDLRGRSWFSGGAMWHDALLDRLRDLAEMDSPAAAALQRGRFLFSRTGDERPSLFRVSILRGVEGEEAQVGLIAWEEGGKTLQELGLGGQHALVVRQSLAKPGLVWVSAPGEAGVGSTLFGLLRQIPKTGKTVTMEEEVFYRSPGFLQIETWGLEDGPRRDILRELRNLDFSRVLVDRVSPARLGDLLALSLRGRWVLAATAAASMQETLGGIAARAGDLPLYGLRLVLHQRLVPVLCERCRVPSVLGTAEEQVLRKLIAPTGILYQEGEGCDHCQGRGVGGMQAFFDVLPVDVQVREALYAEARGEAGIDGLLTGRSASVAAQLARAVAAGTVSLSELWDVA